MKRRFNILLATATVLASMSVVGVASADEPSTAPPAKTSRGTITLPDTVVTGQLMRPQVAVAISRMEPALTLSTMIVNLVARIEDSISKGPF